MRYEPRYYNRYDDRMVHPSAHSRYDDEMDYDYDRRRDYDYRSDPEMDMRRSPSTGRYIKDGHYTSEHRLPEEDIEMWTRELMSEMEEKDRQLFRMESVIKRAKEMGVNFDKFSEEEFYLTVIMMHTALSKVLTNVPMDNWIKMAKAWLCDPMASKRYGKKLAAYYENIVNDF